METKELTKKELPKTYTKVIFGFGDTDTGNKLREFYLKHTGKDIDFNQIKHYCDGFKLLVFDLPLGKFTQVGITAALCAPKDVFKFHGNIDQLIYWYEHEYLQNQATKEQK